jgi:hypothetical protein
MGHIVKAPSPEAPRSEREKTLATATEQAVVDTDVGTPAEAKEVSADLLEQAKTDPVKMNDLGLEPWFLSGVGWFGTGGVLWAFGFIITQVATNGLDFAAYDMETMMLALGSLGGFIGVIYRRYAPGLKPMFFGIYLRLKGSP